jgi:hypothetical protein
MTEVHTVPGAVHKLNIPSDAKFHTKLTQHSLNPAQKKYLHTKVDDMVAAGITAPIHLRDVHAVTPVKDKDYRSTNWNTGLTTGVLN